MKLWILLIFKLAQPARRLIDKLQEKIERIALDPFGQTERQYERILSLSDKRAAIINLLYMHRMICEKLDSVDATVLELYSRGKTGKEIGEACGETPTQIFIRIRRVVRKAERALVKVGYDEARLEKEYLCFNEIKNVFLRLKIGKRKDNKEVKGLVF